MFFHGYEDKIKSLVGQEFSLTPTYTYCSKKTCENNTEPKVVISGLTLMGNFFKNRRAELDNIPGNIIYYTVPSNE